MLISIGMTLFQGRDVQFVKKNTVSNAPLEQTTTDIPDKLLS